MIGTQLFKPYAECASKRKPDEKCAMITLVMRNYYKTISEKKKFKYHNDPAFRERELQRRKDLYHRKKLENLNPLGTLGTLN